MYEFKKELNHKDLLKNITVTEFAEKIGVSRNMMSQVFNRKKNASKILAYCITKELNENAEINDYFDRKGK